MHGSVSLQAAGEDVRNETIEQRKDRLLRMLPGERLRPLQPIEEAGEWLYA